MDEDERLIIVKAIGIVDKALILLIKIRLNVRHCVICKTTWFDYDFANGGDQNNNSIRRYQFVKES